MHARNFGIFIFLLPVGVILLVGLIYLLFFLPVIVAIGGVGLYFYQQYLAPVNPVEKPGSSNNKNV